MRTIYKVQDPQDIYKNLDVNSYSETLKTFFKERLTERQIAVLDYRSGLTDGHCRTYTEIAKAFNVSITSIRTNEFLAISKLRRSLGCTAQRHILEELMSFFSGN